MHRYLGRINRLEDKLKKIAMVNDTQLHLSEEDRKIAREVARRLSRWVCGQVVLGRDDEEVRAESIHICKQIAKEIQNEIENKSLKLL